jgi:hypothetical protein
MTTIVRSPVLVAGIVVGVGLAVAEIVGSGPAWRVALSGGIPIAYATLVAALSRRSDSLGVLAGRPVDERAGHINEEASTWAFGITGIFVIALVAVQIAIRGDWLPYAAVAVAMAVAYIGSLAVLEARR